MLEEGYDKTLLCDEHAFTFNHYNDVYTGYRRKWNIMMLKFVAYLNVFNIMLLKDERLEIQFPLILLTAVTVYFRLPISAIQVKTVNW